MFFLTSVTVAQVPAVVPADELPLSEEIVERSDAGRELPVLNARQADRAFQIGSLASVIGTTGKILLDGDAPASTTGAYLHAMTTAAPDVQIRLGASSVDDDFRVLNGAGSTLFSVLGDGKFGIGTATPLERFHVVSATTELYPILAHLNAPIAADANAIDAAIVGQAYQNVAFDIENTGDVRGVSGKGFLHGPGHVDDTYGVVAETGATSNASTTGSIGRATGLYSKVSRSSAAIATGYGLRIDGVQAGTAYGIHINDMDGSSSAYGIYQVHASDKNYFGGTVNIGATLSEPPATTVAPILTVEGNMYVRGRITGNTVIGAVYQDVAEWVPATTDLAPGTVVVLNPDKSNEVMASHASYSTMVAGVVSEQPGVILGVEGANKEQVATTGRVKVRVDARTAAVRVGDLLVTSDIPGTAMKSEPMQIQGRKFHQPGTIIGKALEPLADGVGEILVLLSMQ